MSFRKLVAALAAGFVVIGVALVGSAGATDTTDDGEQLSETTTDSTVESTDDSTTDSSDDDQSDDGAESTDSDATEVIEIPSEQVYETGDPGSTVAVGSTEVAADLVGRTCNVEATTTNQQSIHPGNVLVVSSGDSSVEITGIEDEAGAVTIQGGSLTLGDSVTVSVVLGDDGATSLGSGMTVTCEPLPETPTTDPTEAEPTYTG